MCRLLFWRFLFWEDVYKRQDREESGAGKEGNGDAGLVVDIGIFPFFLYDGAPKVRRSLKCPVAVSYTHLDVYKRQV